VLWVYAIAHVRGVVKEGICQRDNKKPKKGDFKKKLSRLIVCKKHRHGRQQTGSMADGERWA